MRIRLAMHGTRNNRIFHLVAIDQRKSRNAQPAELLGVYDPALHLGADHKKVEWSVDRIKYWLGVGALPSKSALKLLQMGRIVPLPSDKPTEPQQLTGTSSSTERYPTSNHPPTESRPPTVI